MMEFTENICDLLDGKTNSIGIKAGYLMLRNYGNYPKKCPMDPVKLTRFTDIQTERKILFSNFPF